MLNGHSLRAIEVRKSILLIDKNPTHPLISKLKNQWVIRQIQIKRKLGAITYGKIGGSIKQEIIKEDKI